MQEGKCTQLNATTYRIDKDSQEVFSWLRDNPGTPTDKYTKCNIVNLAQWSCKYDDESGEFGFSNGEFFEVPNIGGFHYVSESIWNRHR